MKIQSKVSAFLLILIFSLSYGQEAKEDSLVFEKEKVRKGFTVIEWGGSKISHGSKKIIK